MSSTESWPIGRALIIIAVTVAAAFAAAWVRWGVIGDSTPTPSTIELCYEGSLSDDQVAPIDAPCDDDPRAVRTVPDDDGRTTRPPATRAPTG